MASQATRVKRVWSVLKGHLVQPAHRVLMGYKVKMDVEGNKDQLDLKVTLDLQDHVGLLVREGTKVTWEREASKVIWDLQVHKEKLVKEEAWDRKVNRVRKG